MRPWGSLNRIAVVVVAVLLSGVPIFVLRGLSWPCGVQHAQITNDESVLRNYEPRARNDSTASSAAASDSSRRILVLYQITATGMWQDIVRDQVTKLIFSGLYERLSFVHCAVAGAAPNATEEARLVVTGYGSKFTVVGLRAPPTISLSIASMHNLTDTDRVLVMSTYGAAEVANSDAAHAAYLWRTLMEYKLIKDYHHCLQLLHQADIVCEPG